MSETQNLEPLLTTFLVGTEDEVFHALLTLFPYDELGSPVALTDCLTAFGELKADVFARFATRVGDDVAIAEFLISSANHARNSGNYELSNDLLEVAKAKVQGLGKDFKLEREKLLTQSVEAEQSTKPNPEQKPLVTPPEITRAVWFDEQVFVLQWISLPNLLTVSGEIQNFENQHGENAAGRDMIIRNVSDSEDQELFRKSVKRQIGDLNDFPNAAAQYALGQLAEGQLNWLNALGRFKSAYNQHPALVYHQAYARLCWRMGQWDEAGSLQQEAVHLIKGYFGETSSEYAATLNNLGIIYQKLRRYPDAERLHDEALFINHRVLGANRPDTATSLNNLAGLYHARGRYSEANPLNAEALSIRRRVLGADHPDTAVSLNNLAALYRGQGRYEDAEQLFEEALSIHRRVLVDDHPDTAQSLNNLAGLYYAQGRYEDAEPLYEEALSIRRRVLGDDHPDTASSLNNLAVLYDAQGRYDEAAPLFREAVEIMERVLGAEHPNTKFVRDNYERFLAEMKE